jgi:hypothetical protein
MPRCLRLIVSSLVVAGVLLAVPNRAEAQWRPGLRVGGSEGKPSQLWFGFHAESPKRAGLHVRFHADAGLGTERSGEGGAMAAWRTPIEPGGWAPFVGVGALGIVASGGESRPRHSDGGPFMAVGAEHLSSGIFVQFTKCVGASEIPSARLTFGFVRR